MDINRFYAAENEKPLDLLPEDGGMTSIFRTIACVGDSLSSGEFQLKCGEGYSYHDMYQYSWGQFLARMTGSTVYNFSRGGMTARQYTDTYGDEFDLWNPEKKAQCYIVAMGVNDCSEVLNGLNPFGSPEDGIDQKTLCGYYKKLLTRYHEIAPHAKFFLVSCPTEDNIDNARKELYDRHREMLYRYADQFPNTYVVDLRQYAPVYDDKFRENFFLYGHMNPAGYLVTAKMIGAYIDFIIRSNPKDFAGVGFIHTELQDKIPTLFD